MYGESPSRKLTTATQKAVKNATNISIYGTALHRLVGSGLNIAAHAQSIRSSYFGNLRHPKIYPTIPLPERKHAMRIFLWLCRIEKKSDSAMGRKKKCTISTAKHGKQSRGQKTRMEKMREAKKRRHSDEVGDVVTTEVFVCEKGHASSPLCNANENNTPNQPPRPYRSASAKKLLRVAEYEDENDDGLREDQSVFGCHEWSVVERGQLDLVLSDISCPLCENAPVSLQFGDKLGLSRKMVLRCTDDNCVYMNSPPTHRREYLTVTMVTTPLMSTSVWCYSAWKQGEDTAHYKNCAVCLAFQT